MIQGMMGTIGNSWKVIGDPNLVTYGQFRFPKTKKARIQKKWRKDVRNYRTSPIRKIFFKNQCMIAHPSIVEQIKSGAKSYEELKEANGE